MRVLGNRPRFFARNNFYAQMKADVTGFRFVPGQHLKARELKRTYDTKSGQVTEVLSHLASEGLIEHRPNRGYFMRKPTWHSVESDYRFARDLATDALIYAQSQGQQRTAANDLAIRPFQEPLPSAAEKPAPTLSKLTGDLYAHIIDLYDVPRASEDAEWLRDRLGYFRTIQFDINPATESHLMKLIRLFEAHEYDALISAVEGFHQCHVEGLDSVLEKAFGQSYSGRSENSTSRDRQLHLVGDHSA